MSRKVLIVDDNRIERRVLKGIINSEYEAIEAENGKEAVHILEERSDEIDAIILDMVMPEMNGFEFLTTIHSNKTMSKIPVIVSTSMPDDEVKEKAVELGATSFASKPYTASLILNTVRNCIRLKDSIIAISESKTDKLTGLYNREAFFAKAERLIAMHEPGYYILSCLDIDNFKVINDQYGTEVGDNILCYIAECVKQCAKVIDGICCRFMADKFAFLFPAEYVNMQIIEEVHHRMVTPKCIDHTIKLRIGRYRIDDFSISVSAMFDRATLAEESIKGIYDIYIAEFNESMRKELIREQNIVNECFDALQDGQFEVWYQPQYNHATGAIIGAEALVRWNHPQKGIVPPNIFIPVFERNGFVYNMDKNIWEQVCISLHRWIIEKRNPLPISINISRIDLFAKDFFNVITGLIEKYEIPINMLRLEITESAFSKTDHIIKMVNKLIDFGFTVEIDDFGSGYSSLNTLKDVPAQILKIDMKFFENSKNSLRGGNIVESVVRMAKWLGMSVIAEGVETKDQADYLKTIGCCFIQGYYYSKPIPHREYEQRLDGGLKEKINLGLETIETYNNSAFWDPKSIETLIFNSYVGGASIIEYYKGRGEIIRVNDRYRQEFGNRTINGSPICDMLPDETLDEKNMFILDNNIKKAIETNAESTCEIVISGLDNVDDRTMYMRWTARVIAKTGDRYMLYCVVNDISEIRKAEEKELEAEKKRLEAALKLQIIMDNVNGGVSAILIDDNGKSTFVFSNDKYYELYGYTKEQVIEEKLDIMELILPEDFETVLAKVNKLKKDGEPVIIDYRCRKRDGSIALLRANSSLMSMEGYGDKVITSVLMDITEQKSVTDQLKAIMGNTQCGISAVINKPEGNDKMLIANKKFFEILGYSEDEYKKDNKKIIDLINPEDKEKVLSKHKELCIVGQSAEIEMRVKKKDETDIWLKENISVVRLDNIEFPIQLSTFYDVTDLHIAEDKQRESVERLNMVVNYMSSGITAVILYEDRTELLFANEQFFNIVGYSRQEYEDMMKADALSIIYYLDREKVRTDLQEASRDKKSTKEEFRIVRSDGKRVWIRAVVTVMNIFGIKELVQVSVFSDITGEKESMDQLSFLNESARDILAYSDCDIALEQTLKKLLDYFKGDRAYVIELDYENGVTNNTYEVCAEGVESEKAFLQNISIELSSHWLEILKKEDYLLIEDVSKIDEDEKETRNILQAQNIHSIVITSLWREGRLIGYAGIDNPTKALSHFNRLKALCDYIAILLTRRDLTAEVRDAENQLLDNLPCGAALYEYDGSRLTAVHINKQYWKLVNRQPTDFSKATVFDAIAPEDRELARQEINAAISQGRNAECDVRLLCENHEYKPFHIFANILKHNERKYSLVASYTPISEETLSIKEMLPIALSTMMSVSDELSFIKDKELKYISCSQSAARLIDMENAREIIGKTDYEIFTKRIADEFRFDDEIVLENGRAVIGHIENVLLKNGKVCVLSTSKYPIVDSYGNTIGIYGIGSDVTEIKQNENQLQLLTSTIPGGLACFSFDGGKLKLNYFNDGFFAFSGYSRQEYAQIINKDPFALIFVEDRPKIETILYEVSRSLPIGKSHSCEYRCFTKDGGYRWMVLKASVAMFENNEYFLNVVKLDITEQKNNEERLYRAEEEYRIALNHTGHTICRYNVEQKTLSFSEETSMRISISKCLEDVPYGRVKLGIISPETQDMYIKFFEDIINGKKEGVVTFEKKFSSGWRWINGHFTTIFSHDGKPLSAIISFFDITDQYEKEAIFKKWQQFLEDKPEESFTLLRWDLSKDVAFDSIEGGLLKFNKSFIGMTFDEFIFNYVQQKVYQQEASAFIEMLSADKLIADFYRSKRNFILEYRENVLSSGTRWLRCSVELVERTNSTGIIAYLMFENINDEKKAELHTQELAETDPLTGVLNRKAFELRVNQIIKTKKLNARHIFMVLDVDAFKQINDRLGHQVGDKTLIELTKQTCAVFRSGDLVGRLGGDEFMVFMTDVADEKIGEKKGKQICDSIRKKIDENLQLSVSIGMAFYPNDGEDFNTLYRKADLALYHVKNLGKDNYAVYDESMENTKKI